MSALWPELNKIVWWCEVWEVFEVVVEGATADVAHECGAGLLRRVSLDVRDCAFGGVPHVLDRIMVRDVGRQVDELEVLELTSRSQLFLQGLGVVEPGIVENHGDLVVTGLAHQASQAGDDLLGVLVALNRVDLDLLRGQGQCAEEGAGVAGGVHVDLCPLSCWEPHAAGLSLVLDARLIDRVHLPTVAQKVFDLLPDLRHPLGDGLLIAALVKGVGQLEVHARKTHEQPVGGSRLILHVKLRPDHVSQSGNVPEVRADAGL